MIYKKSIFLTILFLSTAAVSFAHVRVSPSTVGVGTFQEFVIAVPNEKDIPTTGVRLVIPSGLEYVTPNVKPGWTIETKKEGDQVTEILWTKGVIPAGERDTFVFSAKTEATSSMLIWKAYQTYKDGSVVAWDKDDETLESNTSGPYSSTEIVNDLDSKALDMPIVISCLALMVALISLVVARRK